MEIRRSIGRHPPLRRPGEIDWREKGDHVISRATLAVWILILAAVAALVLGAEIMPGGLNKVLTVAFLLEALLLILILHVRS